MAVTKTCVTAGVRVMAMFSPDVCVVAFVLADPVWLALLFPLTALQIDAKISLFSANAVAFLD